MPWYALPIAPISLPLRGSNATSYSMSSATQISMPANERTRDAQSFRHRQQRFRGRRDGDWYVAHCLEVLGANGRGRSKGGVRSSFGGSAKFDVSGPSGRLSWNLGFPTE